MDIGLDLDGLKITELQSAEPQILNEFVIE